MLAKSDTVTDSAADVEMRPTPGSPWRVVSVTPLPDYRLAVTFRDGLSGFVEMKNLIFSESAGVFAALRDAGQFAQVRVEIGAPVWPGEIDIAPDAIYDGVRASERGEYRLQPAAP